jgi:hypothetical protein
MRRLNPYAARARMIKMRGLDSGLEEEPLAGGGSAISMARLRAKPSSTTPPPVTRRGQKQRCAASHDAA